MPSFSSVRETVKPGTLLPSSSLRSTMNSVMPSWRASGSVLVDQHDEVGAGAVGDEDLRAVDHVLVAVAARGRADPGDVGAGAGLGDPEAADLLALDPGDEVALLLVLGAEHLDRRQDHVGVDGEAHVEPAGAASRRGTRRGRASSSSRRPGRRTPRGSRGRRSRARPSGAGPSRARGSPRTRSAFGASSFSTHDLHRLAQVLVLVGEDQVLAGGPKSGLRTCSLVAVAIAASPRSRSRDKVDSSTSHFLLRSSARGERLPSAGHRGWPRSAWLG